METPMQEVFAHLRASTEIGYDFGKVYCVDWLLEKEKSFLEKEKEAIEKFGGIQWNKYPETKPPKGVRVLTYRPLASETGDDPLIMQEYGAFIRTSPQGVEHGWTHWCHVTRWAEINLPNK